MAFGNDQDLYLSVWQSLTGEFLQERYDPRVSNVPPLQPPTPQWQPAASRPPRGLAMVSVGIALVAVGIAIGAWFRPLPKNEPPPAPTYSSQEVADAKSKVCAAFLRVHEAVKVTSARDKGPDYTTQLASAVNARQALVAGSQYLSTVLQRYPATPLDLAKEIRQLIDAYQLLTVQLLADSPESTTDQSVHSGDEATRTIATLCK